MTGFKLLLIISCCFGAISCSASNVSDDSKEELNDKLISLEKTLKV